MTRLVFANRFLVKARRRGAALLAVPILTVMGGCSPDIEQRGELPPPEKIAAIHPGNTTKDQVVKILGTPSSTGIFDDKSWYYISRRTKQISFLAPDVMDQQVYIVNFDDKGVVKDVDHKGLKDSRDITPAPGATPAPGRELSFLEQVLGNVGRFTKGAAAGGSETGGNTQTGPSPNGGSR